MSAISAAADGQRRILKMQLLALLPVSIAAVVNCGYQYLSVLAAEPGRVSDDLRSNLAAGLGASYQEPGLDDWIAAGLAHF